MKSWPILVAVVVLAGAVGIQLLNPTREASEARPKHLEATVPVTADGWVVRDVPLGPTEFQSENVSKVLNYDDVLNREFRRGDISFGVYAAYWGPGKMPTRLVASHTPDRCWTENGWNCVDMRFNERVDTPSGPLFPADWREFLDPAGDTTYVMFWHLIEGKVHDYGERFNAVPHPLDWWKDAFGQAVYGSREQYFVRLTSSVPFETIWDDQGIQQVVDSLSGLGLVEQRTEPLVR